MTYADRIPAPRPIPTTRQRLTDARACGHTPDQHRHDDGQAADAASHDRAIRELTAERDNARTIASQAIADLDSTRQTAAFRQGVIDRHRQELGAAGEVLAVVRDAVERIDRALARYDTQPGVTAAEPEERQLQHVSVLANCIACGARCPNGKCPNDTPVPPSSVPPRRAQEDPSALPAWVLNLVRGLDRYELEHPQLYRQMGAGVYVEWACPAPLLAFVPAEVRRQAEREG